MIWAYISATAAAAALATGSWLGYKHMEGEVFKAQAEAKAADSRAKGWEEMYGKETLTVKTVEKTAAAQIKTITKFIEVERGIPYQVACVQEPVTGKSVLPGAFRMSWNRSISAANTSLSSTGVVDGDTTDAAISATDVVDPADALRTLNTISERYATLGLRWVGLQEWIKDHCGPFATEKK